MRVELGLCAFYKPSLVKIRHFIKLKYTSFIWYHISQVLDHNCHHLFKHLLFLMWQAAVQAAPRFLHLQYGRLRHLDEQIQNSTRTCFAT